MRQHTPSNCTRTPARLALLAFLLIALVAVPRTQPPADLYTLYSAPARIGWTFQHHLQAAAAWQARGALDRAVDHWRAALALPEEADAEATLAVWRALADAHLARQQWHDAARALDAVLLAQPDDPDAHYQLGIIRLTTDPSAARDHLRRAASLAPAHPLASLARTLSGALAIRDPSYLQLGLLLYEGGLWGHAEATLNRALIGGEPVAEAWALIGLARQAQGKPANLGVSQAARRDPANPRVRYLEGLYWLGARDFNASLAALGTAILLDPRDPALYAAFAEVYRATGDLDSVDYWLAQAAQIAQQTAHPDAEGYWLRLARWRAERPPSP